MLPGALFWLAAGDWIFAFGADAACWACWAAAEIEKFLNRIILNIF